MLLWVTTCLGSPLEQLDSAANALTSISDSGSVGVCGIAPSDASRMLLALHPLMDEEQGRVLKRLSKSSSRKSATLRAWEKTCRKSCHCGIYASLLEGIEPSHLSGKEKQSLKSIETQAQTTTPDELKSCTKRFSDFCGSDLLRKLRKDLKNYPDPSGGNP